MKVEWEITRNGLGSIDYWWVSEPLGTFVNIFPIVTNYGIEYQVDGPAGRKNYSTLQAAKAAGEFMVEWMEDNPGEQIPVPGCPDTFICPLRNCPLP